MQTNLEMKSLEDDTPKPAFCNQEFRLLISLQFLVVVVPFENLIIIKT